MSKPDVAPYPMLMRPLLVPKVWGGRELLNRLHPERAGEFGPSDLIGESWELADHADGVSTIANGRLAGQAFGEVLRAYPKMMAGREEVAGRFPLLIKFIDAREDLSVQVHPNDAQAAVMTRGDRGKTECWFVMHAEPGTEVQHGLRPGVGPAEMRAAIEGKRLRDVLRFYPVEPGMFLEMPAGVVHALLGGTLICEVQQNSNTTYRLYDYDRQPPRGLHIEESLAVIDYAPRLPERPLHVPRGVAHGARLTLLTRCAFFQVVALQLAPGLSFELGKRPGEALAMMVVGGDGRLWHSESGGAPTTEAPISTGQTWYLPAALAGLHLHAGEGSLTVLLAQSFEL